MRSSIRSLAVLVMWLAATPVAATFHLWTMSELYSNADGTVQFLELHALSGGQEFMSGHTLRATNGTVTNNFTFPGNLPFDSAGRSMLIGTQGFAALGVVQPDYVVPNGFFFQGGGSVNFAEFADVWNHGALPSPPQSLNRGGTTSVNSPQNFAGQTGSITATPTPPPVTHNVQALWWGGLSQSGWGVNVTHQGNTLFATWFTYDLDGSALWLSSDLHPIAGSANAYTGILYQTRGSPFNVVPYDQSKFVHVIVGTITMEFTDADHGTFRYTVNGIGQEKQVERYIYASPSPSCSQTGGTQAPGNPNFEDLWWAFPAASESGWGVNISHQGNILVATWFTYAADGSDAWFFMSAGQKIADRTYRGDIQRTTSAPFNAYNTALFRTTPAGTGTFTFADNSNGTFSYTIDGVPGSKQITRYVFDTPTTVCVFPMNQSEEPPMYGGPYGP